MRRSGKTTKIIDAAIQQLFTEGEIWIPSKYKIRSVDVYDVKHFEFNEEYKVKAVIDEDWNKGYAQEDLSERIIRRIDLEHKYQYEIEKQIGLVKIKLK